LTQQVLFCAEALKTKPKFQKPRYKSDVSNTMHLAALSCFVVTKQQG